MIYLTSDQIKRGDIIFAYMGEDNILGSEQKGDRPYLIIQNDTGNRFSRTVIGVPVTTELKKEMPTHMKLGICNGVSLPSTALFEQVRTIDKSRLGHYLGSLSPKQIKVMDRKIKVSLGL